MIGLNIGSGQRPFTSTPAIEWINLDKIARPLQTVDILCDAAHLPYEDNYADYVVLVQVLEHFSCKIASEVLSESYRVLKPGGSLLLSVPDVRALCTEWLNGTKLDTQLFITCLYGAYMGSDEDRHKWGYDEDSLFKLLRNVAPWRGYSFHPVDPPGSSCPHDWWILEVECVK